MGCWWKCSWEESEVKIPLVNDNCIGCGACVAICDSVFEMDDEGKAFTIKWMDSSKADCIDDAIWACPVSAIQYKN